MMIHRTRPSQGLEEGRSTPRLDRMRDIETETEYGTEIKAQTETEPRTYPCQNTCASFGHATRESNTHRSCRSRRRTNTYTWAMRRLRRRNSAVTHHHKRSVRR